jgi:hypothetical protein
MQIADLSTGAGKLSSAMCELQLAWQHTKTQWSDTNSHSFEKDHLQPMVPVIKAALDATSELTELLARAQQECEL